MGFGKVANVGSCALCALIIDNRIFMANLGDSKGIKIHSQAEDFTATDLNVQLSANLEDE